MRKSKRQKQNPKKTSDFEDRINAKITELQEELEENTDRISHYYSEISDLEFEVINLEKQIISLEKQKKEGPENSHQSKARHAKNDKFQKTFSSFLKGV